ncbi:MAG: hypothetical protein BMS9Abin33_0692 [Gammaproteobacteria bacterium]|nr:MAG: hypothetical protein BMS9Abin33_0692 [Gammaproteobacteria bacterium]
MNTDSEFTREDICAFIDGEMTDGREKQIEEAMQHDADLRDDINTMREIRSLYRLSFQDTSTGSSTVKRLNQTYTIRAPFLALAASLFVVVGLSLGWLLHDPAVVQPVSSHGLKNFYSLKEFVQASTNINKANVILRINEDPVRLIAALDDLERLLLTYEKNSKTLNLEIIAHASGLNILRADVTPVGRRIQDLMSRHKNLTILACNKTIRRLKDVKGIDVKLLPGVLVVPSAIDQVLKRLQEKWTYVHI